MELTADGVPAERAHDAEPSTFGVLLDRPSDRPHRGTGSYRLDPEVEALLGDADQLGRACVDLADAERGVGVAVHAVEEDRDVDVHDLAVAERPVVWDAVTDHLVDGGADTLGEALVPERARIAAPLDVRLVRDAVELVGG